MIIKNGRKYLLQCDYCSNYVEDFEEFIEAVGYKKANGWKAIRIGTEWIDKCPECQKKGI